MSEYTTEVRFICETLAGYEMSQGYGKVEEIIDKSWQKVFDFDFPIFDEEYRSVLCKKILRHYYTREIGFETVGLWKLKLSTKMQEIMPYYNKLYNSELIEFNPLYDTDYTKSGSDDGSGEHEQIDNRVRSGSSSGRRDTDTTVDKNETSNSWNVFSDTPQGALTNVDDNTYLTDARKITGGVNNDDVINVDEATSNTTSETDRNVANGNFSNTREYVEHVVGKFPGHSYTKLLVEFRDSLLNIDMRVIDDLNKLFMLVW